MSDINMTEPKSPKRPHEHEDGAGGGGGCPMGKRPNVGEKKGVYYSDYLKLDDLLSLQQPESAKAGKEAHEEHLFIIMHQTYELWFKQILHELESVIALFSQATLPERFMAIVVNRLERVTSILKILVEQITILETMDPLDFLEFREGLSPASGFQSVQFRVLENKLGMLQESRIQYQQTHYHTFFAEQHQKQLEESENSDTLLSLIVKWLERMPFLQFHGFDFWQSYKEAAKKVLLPSPLPTPHHFRVLLTSALSKMGTLIS
jgi:tryptophan 2,3-dioxygenase